MTNRITEQQVYGMMDNVNRALAKSGSNGRVSVGNSYGKFHIYSSDTDHEARHCHIDTIRGFLTKREAYDMLYAMLRMIDIVNDK